MKEKFRILGMHCSSCSSHIEKDVLNLNGVDKCSVNLLQESMLVEYDESIINAQGIIKCVVDAGFDAQQIQKEDTHIDHTQEILHKKKMKVIYSFALLIPLMYLSMGAMFNLVQPQILNGSANTILLVSIQAFLTLCILILHNHYFINGTRLLFKGAPSMDSLIAIGAGASFLYSFYLLIMMCINANDMNFIHAHAHNIYFESAAMIVTLISLGKYLEDQSKKKTSEAVSKLMDLSAKSVLVIREDKEVEIESEDIIKGDIILIKPGMNIPVDGSIIEGSSSVDESSISGESILLEKEVGDSVISGTLNTNGFFKMKAEKVGDETTLAQIIQLVENANATKPQIAKLADKVSGIFVPIVISIAIIAFLTWMILGYSFSFSLSISIAILVISCPCALGLATPTAVMVGSGKAAENGILLKRSESLEILHHSDTIILDKTGTITYGKPFVETIFSSLSEKEVIQMAASIEAQSEHPLSQAILNYAQNLNISLLNVKDFSALVGRGAKGVIEEKTYYVGNLKLIKENDIALHEFEEKAVQFAQQGAIPIYIANEKEVIGIISLKDQIKPTSKDAIKKMKQLGLNVYMVTGDNKITASLIQKELGIDNVYAEALPQDKEAIIQQLQDNKHHVIMVGDGINDAPALSRANVGIAIGAGSDIALECADIILIKNDLTDVLNAITLSHAIIRNIKQNLFWAFFYNVIGIPLAAGLFYIPFGILLNPMFGAAAMSLSSVCVVLNALRLKRK